ncbi:AmpG family muropeptide MFS transporter [Xanthomonas cannabis]|uniref:PAT family beta-lactamase induction signal transducer AmpG n=1 Tax=Xanthomonas cannabis TaxID=1885674 RepID=A0ABR6JMP7_9XANT|nr:MFS transporter [Xanthomonas cannabis]MBB4594103.1 PAT family beta-lactamase induction signal transducer AmpG [Xanthomonas cannabis]MBB5522674.1 PAT family beta-lactamase induction signal transducer AmpG [Xanthomonas cannabis]
MNETAKPRRRWQQVLTNLRQRKVLAMLLLGFSSGLPLYLVGNTLGFWMRKEGIDLGTIGFLSWVGLAYTMKFLWAPIVDKTDVPLLGRLGRRRGWMLLSQAIVAIGLIGMALVQPKGGEVLVMGIVWEHLLVFGAAAVVVAFASATQDIVIDAWRIESADNSEQLGLLTSASALGYRSALLVTDALILIIAARVGWQMSYEVMAALMVLGVVAVTMAREPAREAVAVKTRAASLWTPGGLFDAIAGPFLAFVREHRGGAILILVAISVYRMADFVMGPMANPFYVDLGLSEDTVGTIRGSVGLVATFIGIAAAGLVSVRWGVLVTLIAGAVLGPCSNLAFAWLAYVGPDTTKFAVAMAIDNFANGFAGTALIAYMSSLTSIGYTATQYALLSSFYAMPGKALKGFSGWSVQVLTQGRTLMEGYALFFIGTALVAIPVVILCGMLILQQRRQTAVV